MGIWTDQLVPRLTDRALSSPEIGVLRAEACRDLSGRVLEIGFGSGLNLPHYPAAVTSVCAVEPADAGWALSHDRRLESPIAVNRVGLDGQQLSADDASYDAVLSTFTLCTIPDAGAALAEVRRVLRPGGSFHFLEHGMAPDAGVVRWQKRLEPLQQRVFGGCHLTRDVPALVTASGLEVTSLRQEYLPGPSVLRPWSYGSIGTALRPA